jgi:pyruvate formate lyase activating enzyme
MTVSRRSCIKGIGSALGVAAFGSVAPLVSGPKRGREHVARFWHAEGDTVMCELCPHGCVLHSGKTGNCRNRFNRNGTLIALGYANPCALHVDPIEKKPVYHMTPGARTYSVGVAGCNLRCKNCQNYSISQRSPRHTDNIYLPPEKAVEEALRHNCPVVAFTYTEPSVWLEYVIDTAREAKNAGLKTVLVSSGYINAAPYEELTEVLDTARIDLKSFSDKVYNDLNAGKLQPVLDTLKRTKKRGVWLEIINLMIPGWNDSPAEIRKLCTWVREELGTDTPLHFSRFYPMYQLKNSYPTPVATLKRAVAIAAELGMKYVYIGNVADVGTTTRCPSCGRVLVDRTGYTVKVNTITAGKCVFCGATIAGIWEDA